MTRDRQGQTGTKLVCSPARTTYKAATMQVSNNMGRTRSILLLVLAIATIVLLDRHFISLINLPGLLTVIGGTLLATVISRSARELRATLRQIPGALRFRPRGNIGDLEALLNIAEWRHRGNLRAADQELARIQDPFLHTGIRMVLDRTPAEDFESVMEWRIQNTRDRESRDIDLLRTMAGYAPSFGMLGTLLGLMHMLYGLGTLTTAGIGSTLGFALLSTLYGIVAANLLLKPVAMKMEQNLEIRLTRMQMMYEAVRLLERRRHPVIVAETIAAFSTAESPASEAAAPATLVPARAA